MGIRSRLLTGLLALPLLLNGGVALAQDGGSVASLGAQLEPININLENPEGDVVATAAIWETTEGVHFTVLSVPGGPALRSNPWNPESPASISTRLASAIPSTERHLSQPGTS